VLRQALMNVLVDHDREQRPFADGPLVRAVDIEVVRQEFHRSYPAEGDAAAKKAIRQKAFRRAVIAAQQQNLVGVRQVNGLTLVWLINASCGRTIRTTRDKCPGCPANSDIQPGILPGQGTSALAGRQITSTLQ
jgi:hypothetical protein